MGRGSRVNERVTLPFLQEFLGVLQHCGFIFVVRRREIDKRLPQHAAHSGSFGFFRDRIFEVIHVRKSGHAGADLFSRRQPRAPTNEFLGNVLRFRRKNVFVEPVTEGHIVVQSAKEHHRDMSMAVDESRQDQSIFRVDTLAAFVSRFNFCARTYSDDRIVLNDDIPIVVDMPLAIHGDDGAAGDDCVGVLFRRLSVEKDR